MPILLPVAGTIQDWLLESLISSKPNVNLCLYFVRFFIRYFGVRPIGHRGEVTNSAIILHLVWPPLTAILWLAAGSRPQNSAKTKTVDLSIFRSAYSLHSIL